MAELGDRKKIVEKIAVNLFLALFWGTKFLPFLGMRGVAVWNGFTPYDSHRLLLFIVILAMILASFLLKNELLSMGMLLLIFLVVGGIDLLVFLDSEYTLKHLQYGVYINAGIWCGLIIYFIYKIICIIKHNMKN